MKLRVSSLFYIALAGTLIWPSYVGMRLGIIYIQPAKILLILSILFFSIYYFTRPSIMIMQSKAVFSGPVGKWAILFIFFSAIVTLFNGINVTAVKYLYNNGIVPFICLLSGYSLIQNKADRKILVGFALIGGFISIFALLEFALGSNVFMQFVSMSGSPEDSDFLMVAQADKTRGAYRAQANFLHPLVLAQFLVVAIPYIYVQLVSAQQQWLRFYWFATLTSAIAGVYVTGSRAAFISFLAVIVIFIFVSICKRLSKRFNILLLVAIFMLFLFYLPSLLNYLQFKLIESGSEEETSSTIARLVQYERSIAAMERKPLWGWGPSTAAELGGTAGGATIDSYFLSVGIERGVPVLILWFALQISVISGGLRRCIAQKQTQTPYILLLWSNTLALFGFFLVSAILSIDYLLPLAFLLIGIQAALVSNDQISFLCLSNRPEQILGYSLACEDQ